MNFKKAAIIAVMASISAACMVPAVSNAKVFVAEKGVPLELGAQVTGIGTEIRVTTNLGTFECTSTVAHGELVVNGPNHVVVQQLGQGTISGCVFNVGAIKFPATVTDETMPQEATGNTWGTGETSVSFTAHIYSDATHTQTLLTCNFHGVVHGQAVASGGSVAVIGPSVLTGTGPSCPSSGTVHGTAKSETSNGTPIEGNFEETD